MKEAGKGGRFAAGMGVVALAMGLAACGGPVDTGTPRSVARPTLEQRAPASANQEMTMRQPVPEVPVAAEDVKNVDAEIVMQVNRALDGDNDLAGAKIDVSSEEGAVTLRGQAPDPQARERASAIVRNLRPVKSVENLLTLG